MSGVTVTVRQGALRGCRKQTAAGTNFLSFQGVPFARPPVKSLRYKEPQPPESWSGIRDASKMGNPAVHIDGLTKKLVGDEDCLYLNVYTPSLPSNKNSTLRPVLFYIHGGGFHEGSSFFYGPEPLIDQDVVLVTIHYRLGPLGFLSLGTPEVPGNAGLKDQTMALRWVKDNIAVFGGDPNNVTIFGESAGGASVHFHVLSPLSKGLFRRAILQSGSALCGWAISRDPLGRAKRLAVAAGCDPQAAEDPVNLLKFFREAPATKLIESMEPALSDAERRRGLTYTFVPCVEPPATGAFLSRHPEELVPAAQRVPLLVGVTSHEGILLLPGVGTPEQMSEASDDFERFIPYDLTLRRGPEGTKEVAASVKDFYLQGKPISEETLEGYVHMQTDILFARDVLRAARAQTRLGCPVYLYEFSFTGTLNFLGKHFGSDRVPGACHADELGYLFTVPGLPDVPSDSPEAAVRRRMTHMWANFARTGNPTPKLDEEITEVWPPFSESASKYLQIDETLNINIDLFKERMEFWEQLYNE